MAFALLSLILTTTAAPATEGVPETVREWETLWTSVLGQNVDESGRIDFTSLARSPAELKQVAAFVAANDPTGQPARFPTRDATLAYYINAYNALAMYGVVDAGVPSSLGGVRKITFFWLRRFKIGAKSISLYNFENDVIRPLGDPRIHFALNCMVVSCPRLPQIAFTAGKLESQLDAAARTFVNESRNVRIDRGKREVWLSAIFKFYTDDFLANDSNLIAYVNRFRVEKIPPDFEIRFQDYDWTVNDRKATGR